MAKVQLCQESKSETCLRNGKYFWVFGFWCGAHERMQHNVSEAGMVLTQGISAGKFKSVFSHIAVLSETAKTKIRWGLKDPFVKTYF